MRLVKFTDALSSAEFSCELYHRRMYLLGLLIVAVSNYANSEPVDLVSNDNSMEENTKVAVCQLSQALERELHDFVILLTITYCKFKYY